MMKRIRLWSCTLVIVSVWALAYVPKVLSSTDDAPPSSLTPVAFARTQGYPQTEAAVAEAVDAAVESLFGPAGLAAVLSPGDKVVLKVNLVETDMGRPGRKGLGIITDPRIVRHVAGQVRDIIGWEAPADLLVVSDCLDMVNQPPATDRFYRARLDLNEDGIPEYRYDGNQDGILDGGSGGRLINLDAIAFHDGFLTQVPQPLSGVIPAWLPKFMRTPQQAADAGEPNVYCDVYITLPLFKNHQLAGMTCAVKNVYGFTSKAAYAQLGWDRGNHAWNGDYNANRDYLDEMLIALNLARPPDLVVLDALTGNRTGPANLYTGSDSPVDLIFPGAIFAATDPVALDTVMTLLAGYEPASVEYLAFGDRDGLGESDPRGIHVLGLDAFTQLRDSLAVNFPAQYPFPSPYPAPGYWSGPSGVRNHTDFDPPVNVSLAAPQWQQDAVHAFPVTAGDGGVGLARLDLWIDGVLAAFVNDGLDSVSAIAVDLAAWTDGLPHEARLAAWDGNLNCTVSDPVVFTLSETAVSHWGSY